MPSLSSNNYPVGIGYDTNGDPAGFIELSSIDASVQSVDSSSVSATEIRADIFFASSTYRGLTNIVGNGDPVLEVSTPTTAQIVFVGPLDVTALLPSGTDQNIGRFITYHHIGGLGVTSTLSAVPPHTISYFPNPNRIQLENTGDTIDLVNYGGVWYITASGNYYGA